MPKALCRASLALIVALSCARSAQAQDAPPTKDEVKKQLEMTVVALVKEVAMLDMQKQKLVAEKVDENDKRFLAIERRLKEIKFLISACKKVLDDPTFGTEGGNPGDFFPQNDPTAPGGTTGPNPDDYEDEEDFKKSLQGLAKAVCAIYPPYCAIAELLANLLPGLFEGDPEYVRAKTQVAQDLARGNAPNPEDVDRILGQKNQDKAVKDALLLLEMTGYLREKGSKKQQDAATSADEMMSKSEKRAAWIQKGTSQEVKAAIELAQQEKTPDEVLAGFAGDYEDEYEKFAFLNLLQMNQSKIKCTDPNELKRRAVEMKVKSEPSNG
jgi:hypothetical protein